MTKCSACERNECGGKYKNRDKCVGEEEKIKCMCKCKVTRKKALMTSAASIGTGVAVTAGGIGLTVVTGGLFAVVAGAAVVGAGSSLVLSPIKRHLAGERMTALDTAKAVAFGATAGTITGPIGVGGSSITKGASKLLRLGMRAAKGATEATAGALSGGVNEVDRNVKGEEVTLKSVAKSVAVDTVGDASSQLASTASTQSSGENSQAATRGAEQGGAAAATDAGLQLATTGTVDLEQVALNMAEQMAVASTAEASSAASQQTTAYGSRVDEELMAKNGVSAEESEAFDAVIDKSSDHRYQDCKTSLAASEIRDPLEGHLRADQVHANVTLAEDLEDVDEAKKEK